MNDGVVKLQDINDGLKERDRGKRTISRESPSNVYRPNMSEISDNRGNGQQETEKHRSNSLIITGQEKKETVYKTARQFLSIEEESSGSDENGEYDGATEDNEIFDGMLERINERCAFEGTMASQMDRL